MCQFSGKTNNFDFFGPNLPKTGFWGRNFKNLSQDSEYQDTMFSNFPIPCNTRSNNVEGVAESWVEFEMNWVKVDEAVWS